MSLVIGRTTVQPPTKDYPQSLTFNNGFLDVRGWHVPAAGASALVERDVFVQQWSGYQVGDIIPIVFDEDPKLAGYYRVVSMAWNPGAGDAFSLVQYSGGFQRIPGGWANPDIEHTTFYADRSTANQAPQFGYERLTSMHSSRTSAVGLGAGGSDSRDRPVSDGGNVTNFELSNPPNPWVTGYTQPIKNAYDGRCRVEYLQTDGNWYELIGPHLPSDAATGPSDVRMSNGIVRFTWTADPKIILEVWNGSGWQNVGEFTLAFLDWPPGGGDITPLTVPIVERNDESGVVLAYRCSFLSGTETSTEIAVAVTRGERHVSIDVQSTAVHILGSQVTEPATAVSGGIRQTSNGPEGHRWVIGSPGVLTTDLVNGRLEVNPNSILADAVFGLGVEFNGSAADTVDSAAVILGEFWTARTEWERIVV